MHGWEFKDYVLNNTIQHVRTAPYHTQPNGLAERAVRTIKDTFSRMPFRVSFFHYHVRVLLGYPIRLRVDTCFPPLSLVYPQDNQSWNIAPGDGVHVRSYGIGEKWTPGP